MDPNDLTPEELEATSAPSYDDVVENDEEELEEQAASVDEKPQEEEEQIDVEKKPSTVPHAALHEERVKRQAADEQVAELRQQNQRLMDRFDQLLSRFDQHQKQEEQVPDKDQDPIGYMEYLQKELTALKQVQQQTQQQTQQQQQMQAIWNEGNRQAAEFRSQTPDYDDAFQYLYQKRGEELIAMGLPKEQVAQTLQQEAWQGMQYALANKINPGAMVYQMATARGYTKQERVSPEVAQRANRSMSGAGKESSGGLDMNDIVSMSDEEYEKWLDKNGDVGLAKMHGLG